jgi:hypothetical protein
MRESDHQAFVELLDAVCALLSRGAYRPTATNTALFFRALARYELADVRAALDAHVADPVRGRFVPVPADLIAQLQGAAADDGRPGPEEAWAIALRSQDEAETVVWTEEIAQAMGIARPVLDAGDEVGARMAFREAYSRIVQAARHEGHTPGWMASLGFDTERRQVALETAAASGRLSRGETYQLTAPVTAPMLALGAASGAPPHVIDSLRELADKLRNRDAEPSADVLARADTRRRQAETAERVAVFVRGRE